MNEREQEIVREVESCVRRRMSRQQAGHGVDHVLRVFHSARLIQAEVGGNVFVIDLAALLHDIGDAKFHNGIERSGEFAREILSDLNVSEDVISQVESIVESISFRKDVNASELSLEGKVVQDADRLEALGAIGIVRTIEYGAAFDQPFYLPGAQHATSKTGVGHFYQKLFKLRERMNTEPGRRLAMDREQFMREFLDQFFQECGDDRGGVDRSDTSAR